MTTEKPLRVGMFGGAFDPPHGAHRALAEVALEQLGLDVLYIMPTGHAWHKSRVLTPARHRLEMCRLAFCDLPKVHIDDRETRREGASYTVDTLSELAREHPGASLFLILGADQLLAFKTWVRWQEVAKLAHLVVANRATNIGADAAQEHYAETDLSGVDLPFEQLHMPLHNVSATAVRTHLAQREDKTATIEAWVPPAVARYISQHHLYQDPS